MSKKIRKVTHVRTIIPPLYERHQNPGDPFSVDVFERASFAESLTNLFRNTQDGLVLTIDADWGDGKTTFIHLWEQTLKNDTDFIPIYYDAFKNDFTSDAFLSIAVLIHESLKDQLRADGVEVKNKAQLEFLKTASKSLAKDLIKMTAGIAVTSITGGLLSNSSLVQWMTQAFKTLTFGTLEHDIDQKYQAHINAQHSIKNYQEKLKQMLSRKNGGKPRKLVFFVDELDRCRPDFAVQVIEKIKHLFNIENVFFVLAINKTQLLNTIASVYGVSSDDATIYLQKFVHIETRLPPITGFENEPSSENVLKHVKNLIKAFELDYELIEQVDVLSAFTQLLMKDYLNLNPRSIERVLTLISIALGSCEKAKARALLYIIFPMAALKIGDPDFYQECKGINFHELVQKDHKYSMWFKNYLKERGNIWTENLFSVREVEKACKILDIYELPEPKIEKKAQFEKAYSSKSSEFYKQ